MVKLSGQLPLVCNICLEDILSQHNPCNYLFAGQGTRGDRGYRSVYAGTDRRYGPHDNRQVSRIPYRDQLEYALGFERLSITVRVLAMVKWSGSCQLSDNFTLVVTSVLKIFVSTSSRDYLFAVKVPGVDWIDRWLLHGVIVVSFRTEGNHRFSRYPVPWSGWIQVLLIRTTIDHRPGPRDGKIIQTLDVVSHLSWRYSSAHRCTIIC